MGYTPTNSLGFGNQFNRPQQLLGPPPPPKPDPNVVSGQEKLRSIRKQTSQKAPPLVTPDFKRPTPGPLEPVNKPTLQDIINEAQKLSRQKTTAQASILGERTGDIADEFARRLFSQNIGATSGAGQELATRAIRDQAQRLEPFALQQAAELGQQELSFQHQEQTRRQQEEKQTRENTFNQILQGTVDRSQMSQQDWARLGVTDPQAVKTLADVDFANAMRGDGLDPNNPQEVNQYREGLRTAKRNQLRQEIVANYAAVNDGRLPTADETDMMLMLFGGESGILLPEEENALINKFNDEQWIRVKEKAEAMNPPEGKVLCTELYRQGYLPADVYMSDKIVGEHLSRNDVEVVRGYHRWGKPLAKIMSKNKVVKLLLKPFILAWAYEMHYDVTGVGKSTIIGRVLKYVGVSICRVLGKQKEALRWQPH